MPAFRKRALSHLLCRCLLQLGYFDALDVEPKEGHDETSNEDQRNDELALDVRLGGKRASQSTTHRGYLAATA
jgi:hypothetical protein